LLVLDVLGGGVGEQPFS